MASMRAKKRSNGMSPRASNVACGLVLLALVLAAAGMGIYTRSTFIDGDEVVARIDEASWRLSYRPDAWFFDPAIDYPGIESADELEAGADLIAVVRAGGERTTGQYAIVTQAEVVQVAKGDVAPGEAIRLIEPVRIEKDSAGAARLYPEGAYAGNGFALMQDGHSYLAFLKRVEPSSINGEPLGQALYTVLNSPYARLDAEGEGQVYVAGTGESVPAGELSGYNLVTVDEASAEAYRSNRPAVLQRFLGE